MEKCPGYYCSKQSVASKFDWTKYEAVRTDIRKYITCIVCKKTYTIPDVNEDGTFLIPSGWIEIRRHRFNAEDQYVLVCGLLCLEKPSWFE